MQAFLLWLTDRLPVREISGPQGERYLVRYYLGSIFGVVFYLHQYFAPDPGRDLHDHPYSWAVGIPLIGGYLESRLRWFEPGTYPTKVHLRTVHRFRLNLITAKTFHRIEAVQQGTWTLFITGRRTKRWGFLNRVEITEGDPEHKGGHAWWIGAPLGRELEFAWAMRRLDRMGKNEWRLS